VALKIARETSTYPKLHTQTAVGVSKLYDGIIVVNNIYSEQVQSLLNKERKLWTTCICIILRTLESIGCTCTMHTAQCTHAINWVNTDILNAELCWSFCTLTAWLWCDNVSAT